MTMHIWKSHVCRTSGPSRLSCSEGQIKATQINRRLSTPMKTQGKYMNVRRKDWHGKPVTFISSFKYRALGQSHILIEEHKI